MSDVELVGAMCGMLAFLMMVFGLIEIGNHSKDHLFTNGWYVGTMVVLYLAACAMLGVTPEM